MPRSRNELEARESIMRMIEARNTINERYSNIKRLNNQGGRGNFSILFTANDLITKNKIALKFYNPLKFAEIDRVERFRREADLLLKLKGQPNILECIDGLSSLSIEMIDTVTKMTRIEKFEFIPVKLAEGSEEDYIYLPGSKPLTCLYIFKEMCKGVARLHRNKICHRDLKPSNFLIFENNDIRVSDLGCAKILNGSTPDISPDYSIPIGDINYLSPELICGIGISDEYTYKSDMFSLGAILFEMFSKTLFTMEVYPLIIGDIKFLQRSLITQPRKERINIYLDSIKAISSKTSLPDIYRYNDFTPRCIKIQLNNLYKSLAQIDLVKRLDSFSSVFRQIDICIITIENERKYLKWLKLKRLFRSRKITKRRI